VHGFTIDTRIGRARFEIIGQIAVVGVLREHSLRAKPLLTVTCFLFRREPIHRLELARLVVPTRIDRALILIVAIRVLVARHSFYRWRQSGLIQRT
jgi:hypothetical protein